MASEANKAMVLRLVDGAMNGRDFAVIDAICTPDLAAGFRRNLEEFLAGFPDWREEIVQLVAEGDTVVGRFVCSGTHLGTFQGVPPTGKRQEVDEVFFFRFHNGRCVDIWGIEDNRARYQQLGVPVPEYHG